MIDGRAAKLKFATAKVVKPIELARPVSQRHRNRSGYPSK